MILVAVYLFLVLDGACSGWRAYAGRDGLIRKTAYFRRAIVRGIVAGHVVGILSLGVYALLSRDQAGWDDLIRAAQAGSVVAAPYAVIVAVGLIARRGAGVDGRSLLSVLLFGPLLLLRPVVLIATVLCAALSVPTPAVGVGGIVAVLGCLSVEPWLSRAAASRR